MNNRRLDYIGGLAVKALADIVDSQNQSLLHFKISHMMNMSLYRIGTTGLHRRLWMIISKLKMVIIPIHLIV
ncbi:hypothetical protein ACOSP7_017171 [Xanthoceras sorbifolium]